MTISEIAKLAGVSSAAVSRYLNDGSLSQEKRQRIERVIRETKYRPSEYARTMRTKKSNRIGVLVPQIDSESVPKILSGISERMDQKNYHVLLMNSNLSLEKEIGILETFEQSQVDGLIFAASVLTKRHEKALEHMGVPVVILGQKSEKYPCIYHDDEGAACAMMEELLKSGCRRPAYIGVDRRDKAAGENRYRGACHALENSGLHMDEVPYRVAAFSAQGGYQAMTEMLADGKRPDGVLCATDMIAAGVLSCLSERGITVPGEMKVAGMGHGAIADLLCPRLTTVHYHYHTSGREAADLLLDLMEKKRRQHESRMLKYEVIRQKTI